MNKIIASNYQEYIRIWLLICSCRQFVYVSLSIFNLDLGHLVDAKINNAFLNAALSITLKNKVKNSYILLKMHSYLDQFGYADLKKS